ncbi:MAG: hypothetical protein JSS86_01965 [Cyanobacteria bacterium SZAS LIN-2]|nr:hypothetical protein [Cyanobacteria bacterium SZAS LIN-3]MBS1995041.1 hypothetical protein [Cyanobacteria bacterium SZAS LIN-2]
MNLNFGKLNIAAPTALALPLCLALWSGAARVLPALAEKPAAPKAAPSPSTGMAGPGKWVPADLTISGHGCTVLVPGDYSLSEFLPPTGKLFCFKGPAHPDNKTAVFNVTIAPCQKGSDIPSERTVMDVMLNPHRKLNGYKEQKEPIFTNEGHSFKGMSFSGKGKDGKQTSGFVYLTQDKDTYYILFAQDEEPFASKSLPLLLKTARGCQIKKQ